MEVPLKVRMKSNALRASRVEGVLIPDAGQVVDLDDDVAKRLKDLGYAEDPDDNPEKTEALPQQRENQLTVVPRADNEAHEGSTTQVVKAPDGDVVDHNPPEAEAAAAEVVAKRGPGRPPKAAVKADADADTTADAK